MNETTKKKNLLNLTTVIYRDKLDKILSKTAVLIWKVTSGSGRLNIDSSEFI